jgi:hypothetical protein
VAVSDERAPKVYIVQEDSLRKDFSDARRFGELAEPIFGPHVIVDDDEIAIAESAAAREHWQEAHAQVRDGERSRASLGSVPADIRNPTRVLRELGWALRDFGDDDYILAVGDWILVGLAMAVAAQANDGRFNVLKWHRGDRRYYAVAVDMNQAEDAR